MAADPTHADPTRVLMATRNGAAFLEPQLESIAAQQDWALWVSDDGSTDGTREILARFAARHPGREIRVLEGPGRGAAANFLSLLCHPELPPGWAALSDQDDVWSPDRLARARRMIGGDAAPAVYGSRTTLTDAAGDARRPSPTIARAPSFGEALVQNVLAGNTAVLNPAMLERVRRAGTPEVPFHDWWIQLVAAGTGARIVIDPAETLLYRQHGGNVLGTPGRGRLRRAALVLGRGWGEWIEANAAALGAREGMLTVEARAALAALCDRSGSAAARLSRMRAAGIRRFGRAADMALALAVLAGRV